LIIYDCEIQNAIPVKGEPKIKGIRYCSGWRSFLEMGISVICVYDYDTNGFRVFCQDNLEEFGDLAWSTDMVVGFHNWNFDDPLIEAHGVGIPEKRSYDLYKEIYKAHNFSMARRVGGMKLDECVKANFPDKGKTGDGAMAPVLWQQGKIGTVIDYCMQDVYLTKCLLDLVIQGKFVSPKTGRILRVRGPL